MSLTLLESSENMLHIVATVSTLGSSLLSFLFDPQLLSLTKILKHLGSTNAGK